MKGYEKKTSETEMQSNIILACAQTLKLEYDDPMPCSSGTDLEVTVWNKSPLDIVDFKIQVLSVSDSELKEGGRLSSYNKTIYTISGINVADVTSVVLIPTIELDEINGTCSGISFDVGDLEAC